MAWSHNQNFLVSGCGGGHIKVYTPQVAPVNEFGDPAHQKSVRSISFAPTDKKLVSGGDDLQIILWDFPSGKQETVLRGHNFDVKRYV